MLMPWRIGKMLILLAVCFSLTSLPVSSFVHAKDPPEAPPKKLEYWSGTWRSSNVKKDELGYKPSSNVAWTTIRPDKKLFASWPGINPKEVLSRAEKRNYRVVGSGRFLDGDGKVAGATAGELCLLAYREGDTFLLLIAPDFRGNDFALAPARIKFITGAKDPLDLLYIELLDEQSRVEDVMAFVREGNPIAEIPFKQDEPEVIPPALSELPDLQES